VTDYTKPLQAILSRDTSPRPRSVFTHDGRDFASDGRSILLTPPGHASEDQSNKPKLEQIIKHLPGATSFTARLSELAAWLESSPEVSTYCDECDTEGESGEGKCHECRGTGECCKCNRDCEECGGSGKIGCPKHELVPHANGYVKPYVVLGASAIAAPAAYEILSLILAECGDEEITVTTNLPLDLVRFTAREWEYFQAPVRIDTAKDIEKVWGK
jgi:hypothetical protein